MCIGFFPDYKLQLFGISMLHGINGDDLLSIILLILLNINAVVLHIYSLYLRKIFD